MDSLAPRFGPRGPSAWFRMAPPAWWKESAVEAIASVVDDAGTEALLEEAERERAYPHEVVKRLRAAGLASLFADGPDAPSAHVTVPHGFALNALVARRNGSLAITLGVNLLALLPIYAGGDAALVTRVAARVREGALCGLLLTELAHGSNLLRIEARARREGDAWVLEGEKHLINGGTHHAILVTLARTRPRANGADALAARGDLSLLVVDRDASVEALPRWRTLPAHAADIAGVRFHGTRVPDLAVVGGEGNGFGIVQRTLTLSRGGIGALASGAASDALDRALHHARTRDVYGGPIAQLGAIAEHVMRIAALDALAAATSLKAAALANAIGTGAAHATAVAKVACCALAEEAVDEGRRVLGARALVEEGGYARLARDVLLYGVFDGTTHVVLDQLQWRLAQFAAAPPASDAELPAHVAFARAAWARAPRPLIESSRDRARTYLAPIDQRLRALAQIASPLDAAPLVAAAEALLALVRARRAANEWDDDQATRFEGAACLAELEALAALLEVGDPARRAVLELPALPVELDAHVTAYALGWFGARVVSRIERFTGADLAASRRALASPATRPEGFARASLRAALFQTPS